MPEHQIIIDCDPGQDDAVALLLALASPEEIEILAITTVAGNVPLARTTRNAQQVLALAGRSDIPVHAGCARPILRPLETAEYLHGETGLNGAVLPEPGAPVGARSRGRRDRGRDHAATVGHGHLVPDRTADQRGAGNRQGAGDRAAAEARSC